MKLPKLTHGVSVRFFGGAKSSEAEKGAFIRSRLGGTVFCEGG